MTELSQESENLKYPQGFFSRPSSPDKAVVTRPFGMYYPTGVSVQWITEGEGRDGLNEMLSTILVLELDHLAAAAAAGEIYRIDPLKELGDREGWVLHSKLKEEPQAYSLIKDGTNQNHRGLRVDLLLAIELMLRCALKPFEDQAEIPGWVKRSRQVYPSVLKALHGQPLFQAES